VVSHLRSSPEPMCAQLVHATLEARLQPRKHLKATHTPAGVAALLPQD
jgi:hypothetical protein